MLAVNGTTADDPFHALISEGDCGWYDAYEQRLVRFTHIRLPYGDGLDWRGVVHVPQKSFYHMTPLSHAELCVAFAHSLMRARRQLPMHTLEIDNDGSFLAMPKDLQRQIVTSAAVAGVRRLVVSSYPEHVSDDAVRCIMHELAQHGVKLTVRIIDDMHENAVRMRKIRKAHTCQVLLQTVKTLHAYKVTVGGYVFIHQAQPSRILYLYPHMQDYDVVARKESIAAVNALFDYYGMDEVYLSSTCVAQGTNLEQLWLQGRYEPPSLSLVASVLAEVLARHTKPVHLLPFRNEAAFVAIPSNHSRSGVHQDDVLLHEHDIWFQKLFNDYRLTMNTEEFMQEYGVRCHDVRHCSFCNLLT